MFVQTVLGKLGVDEKSEDDKRQDWKRLELSALIKAAAAVFGVSPEHLSHPGKSCRKIKRARALASYLAVEYKGEKLA